MLLGYLSRNECSASVSWERGEVNEPFDSQRKQTLPEVVDKSRVPDILRRPFRVRDTGSDEFILHRNEGVLVDEVEEFIKFLSVVERRVRFGSLAVPGSTVTAH